MDVPSNTIDLIKVLSDKYEDKMELDTDIVGTPEYWMKAGVVKLLNDLKFYIETKGGK